MSQNNVNVPRDVLEAAIERNSASAWEKLAALLREPSANRRLKVITYEAIREMWHMDLQEAKIHVEQLPDPMVIIAEAIKDIPTTNDGWYETRLYNRIRSGLEGIQPHE